MVPHGTSVVLNAPSVFRFTSKACPERHLEAAVALGARASADVNDAGEILATRLIELMRATKLPDGLSGVGYDASDLEALVDRAIVQKRLVDNAPLVVDRDAMRALFSGAMRYA